jgi:hypothetical protein
MLEFILKGLMLEVFKSILLVLAVVASLYRQLKAGGLLEVC